MGFHGPRFTVHGPSRLRPLRWLTRPPLPALSYGFFAVSLSAAGPLFLLDEPAAGALIAPAGVAVALVVAAMTTRPSVNLYLRARIARYLTIDKACAVMIRALPRMNGLIDAREARSVLDRTRLDLARLLADHERVAGALSDAKNAEYGLAPGDPLRADLADRRARLTTRLNAIGAEADRRSQRILDLAQQFSDYVYYRERKDREARAARRALAVLDGLDHALNDLPDRTATADPAADFADHAEAVLTAYRELESLSTYVAMPRGPAPGVSRGSGPRPDRPDPRFTP
jgi:hypothetical protein